MVLPRLIPRLRSFALGGLALGLAGGAYIRLVEPRWLAITHYTLPMAGLPEEWQGVRLAHLSDLHLGSRGNAVGMIHRAIAEAVAFHPDIIALTGDYSEHGSPVALDLLAPLVEAAPTFAVLGNHDYFAGFAGAERIAADLTTQGVTVLRNDRTAFIHKGVAGVIVGFDDDVRGPGADVAGVVARMRGTGPTVALAHEPEVVDRFPPHWAGLTLSGHTHGAQVRLSPLRDRDWTSLRLTEMQSPHLRGAYTVNGNRLYVSRGLGTAHYPLRFAARPELALFTFVQGDDGNR